MVTAVVLVSASGIGLAVSAKHYRAEGARKVSLTEEVDRLEPLAKEYDVLGAEIQEIETRIVTIAEIRATRLRWGEKLDQLYAILPDYVWFKKLELKKGRARGPVAGGSQSVSLLTLECLVAGADETRYAEFRRILTGEVAGDGPYTGEDFFADFESLGYSGWSREDKPETQEGVALEFTLELAVRPLVVTTPVAKVTRPVVAAK